MARIVEFPNRDVIEQEAAAWVAKLDGGALSRKELRGLREWALRSPEHRAAINEMAADWDRLDVLRLLRPAGDVSRGFGRRWRRAGAALAAGLAVVAVTLGTLRILPGELPDAVAPAGTTYLTAIGELQSVTLSDGTHVHINTNSRLQVDYSEEKRGVLLHLGEAYFEVANSDRPFVVSAGNGQITALGTAFAVRVTEDNVVDVDVTEGMVVITAGLEFATTGAGSSALTSRVASAGQVVRMGETIELVRTVEPARLERELAWRDGMLVFDGDTLEHVIAEVSRYSSVEIVIADPSLRDLKVGGYFRAGDTQVLLNTLSTGFGIDVERVRPGLVYLHPAGR